MPVVLLPLLLCLTLGGCKKDEPPLFQTERTRQAPPGDEALERAAGEARKSLPCFLRHLQHPLRGEEGFSVKYPFAADPGSGFLREYLWLGDIVFREGVYYGKILNRPYHIREIEAGMEVPFSFDDIADWMFLRKGKIIGGLSIRRLIEDIPPLDREEELNRILDLFETPGK
ncbi:MAG: DUF2314 domain-containing protein [Treponema sp.]|jgi:uncharacterized protein YegJ (DUF2314 family)|nr:DUF2314 domain-containing protein [Treponema sp.]